jgi:hypothetical protein
MVILSAFDSVFLLLAIRCYKYIFDFCLRLLLFKLFFSRVGNQPNQHPYYHVNQ